MDLGRLKDPFLECDVEWRVQTAGQGRKGLWAIVVPYITNRAVMDRLDDVCGQPNWHNEYCNAPEGGVLCGISIYIAERDQWVTKWDGADNTQIDATKGGLSGSMKRAAAQWGIGRYLYNLSEGFANIHEGGRNRQGENPRKSLPKFKWDPPKMPKWALPEDPE